MTILLATNWPSTLPPATCEFGRSRNHVEQRSPRSRLPTVVVQARPLWACSLSWRLPATSANELRWHLENLEGRRGTVLFPDFNAPTRTDLTGFTITAQSAASAGATSLTITGLPINLTPAVRRGELIQAGRRLYIIAADANSNASGVATLTLTTPLVFAVAAAAATPLLTPRVEMRMVAGGWSTARRAEDGYITARADFLETVSDYTAIGPSDGEP